MSWSGPLYIGVGPLYIGVGPFYICTFSLVIGSPPGCLAPVASENSGSYSHRWTTFTTPARSRSAMKSGGLSGFWSVWRSKVVENA